MAYCYVAHVHLDMGIRERTQVVAYCYVAQVHLDMGIRERTPGSSGTFIDVDKGVYPRGGLLLCS